MPRSKLAAIALIAAAVILLQIAVTRILSVVLWYHYAFFSISVAMLGLGAPGVWFSLWRRRGEHLGGLLLASSMLVPAGIIGIVKGSKYFGASAILFCIACLLPAMLALGASVCVLLLEARGAQIGTLYAFDLLGACTGALLMIPLLWTVPTPQLAGLIGLLPLGAYLLVGGRRLFGAVVAAGLVLLVLWGEPFAVRHAKAYEESGPRQTPIYERWTPTARLTVFDNIFFIEGPPGGFGWGFGKRRSQPSPPEQFWMEQDGSAGTPITRFDGDLGRFAYLFDDVTSAPYQLYPLPSVAIVGAGGGRDVLTALASGCTRVDAIELNAGIVEVLRGRFGEFSGHIYDRPGVRAIVGEGRSVLTRSDGRYDLIQISLTDSWAATAAGAYTLSENNLYTLEAYRLYWSRLTPNGLISTSRWMAGPPALEIPRLVLLVRAALEAEGVTAPAAHIAVLQGGAVGTVLVKRAPFTPGEIDRLRAISGERRFALHLPVSNIPPDRQWLPEVLKEGAAAYRDQGLELGPPTDDRPFFFQAVSPFRPLGIEEARRRGINAEGVLALRRLMLVMTVVTVLLFFSPFPLARWLRPEAGVWRGSLFFAAIGLAFMFVEIAWLQRFILYLGHPSHATTATLGGILLGAGLGSFSAGRLGVPRGQRLGFLLPLGVLVVNLGLGPLFTSTLGWPWLSRLAMALGVIVPAGFLMGFCFPLGMVRFGDGNKAWFWAVNGAAGVLASVSSLALSMELGYWVVANLGAGLYVAAWLLLAGRAPRAVMPIRHA